jgi:uncharacterized hydrophobic protein (TIGR00271 family)
MIKDFLHKIANIKDSSDINNTVKEIGENISLKGYNVWILICSALLASIGLDTNSVAVIIGAMLISPLMSPILGLGLSIGIHDNEMFRHSTRNLIIATAISLITSFLYFSITPFGEVTSEILARTKPTILDVGVAFFGGIAGIVSISRKDKTTAIPGVAIATALMPPLCTAGYGLAKLNFSVFGGALYLFVINAVFISISTFLIVKYLKFPVRQYVDKLKQKAYAKYAAFTVLLLLIPSIYFLITVYKEIQFKGKIQNSIVKEIESRKNEVLKWIIIKSDSVNEVKFYISGAGLNDSDKVFLQKKFIKLGLNNYKPVFSRVNISKDEVAKMSLDITQNLLKSYEFDILKQQNGNKPIAESDSLKYFTINKELRLLHPDIRTINIGSINIFKYDSTKTILPSVTIEWINKKSSKAFSKEYLNFYNYLKSKLNKDTLILKSGYSK